MPLYNDDGTFDYTNEMQAEQTYGMVGYEPPAADLFSVDYAMNFINNAGTATQDAPFMGNFGGAESAGEAITAQAPKEDEGMVNRLFGWFDKKNDRTQGAIVTLAGSFIKGMFSYSDEQRKVKALEKQADASMLNAQNNVDVQNTKFANASSIGKTNFGAAPKGLIYSNKLAERQRRSGYGG